MAVTPEMVTMAQAAEILGVSNAKIWRLVKEGNLPVQRNPLDRREKLIYRDDLDRFRARQSPERGFLSDGIDADPVEVPSDRIKTWVRESWHPNDE